MPRASPEASVALTVRWDATRPPPWAQRLLPIISTNPAVYGGFIWLGASKGDESMSFTIGDDQQIDLTVAYVDAKGAPASVDGDVTWASSDETIATVAAGDAANTMVATVVGVAPGSAQITATADADRGDGVTELVVTGTITVVAGNAVAGTFTPGEATAQA